MRTSLRSKATLLFIVCAALLALGGTAMAITADTSGNTAPTPTIQSDKADYAPGELVTLTGSGWQAGESVNIVVNDDVGQTWNRNVNVTADASGNISDSFNLPDWFVATYSVKATGASGTVATSSFTDALKTTTTVTSSKNPSSLNESVTFTAKVTYTDTGSGHTAGDLVLNEGTVVFGKGGNANCSGTGWTQLQAPQTNTSGQVTYTTSTLAVGNTEIKACFDNPGGGSAGGGQSSGTFTQTVNATQTLSVTKAGTGTGTVTSSPTGINCGTDCSANFNNGASVTLTASPDASSTFVSWSGGGGTTNADGTYTVSMSQARSVTATFTLKTYALDVTKAGTGTVTSSPTGINCGTDCSESYNHGTSVTLTAAPDASSTFASWSGAGTTNADGTRTVSMSQAQNVTATFTLKTYALDVTKAGTGTGTVTSSPAGINCGTDCSESYNHGTSVTLTANAGANSTFDPQTGWSGGSGTVNADGTYTVSMSQARSVTATFVVITHQLSVTKDGAGTGTVTSDPTGINCGTDCSESYVQGTSVTLTAAPVPTRPSTAGVVATAPRTLMAPTRSA